MGELKGLRYPQRHRDRHMGRSCFHGDSGKYSILRWHQLHTCMGCSRLSNSHEVSETLHYHRYSVFSRAKKLTFLPLKQHISWLHNYNFYSRLPLLSSHRRAQGLDPPQQRLRR